MDRVVFLDADMVVLQNIDDLFGPGPPFRAAPDCGWHCDGSVNSGLMVLSPSNVTFSDMMHQLDVFGSSDGGDQGFLNAFFSGPLDSQEYPMLDQRYNFLKRVEDLERENFSLLAHNVSVVHNVGHKPWHSEFDPETNFSYPECHGAYFAAHDLYEKRCHSRVVREFRSESNSFSVLYLRCLAAAGALALITTCVCVSWSIVKAGADESDDYRARLVMSTRSDGVRMLPPVVSRPTAVSRSSEQ